MHVGLVDSSGMQVGNTPWVGSSKAQQFMCSSVLRLCAQQLDAAGARGVGRALESATAMHVVLLHNCHEMQQGHTKWAVPV
jgi:hypothetical protein